MRGARQRPTRLSWYFHCKEQCGSNAPPPTTRAGWFFAKGPSRRFVWPKGGWVRFAKMLGPLLFVSRAQRSMKRSVMMRCRPGTAAVRGGPGSAMHRFATARAASRPGHATASHAFAPLFTFQTAQLVPAPAFLRPGFASLLRLPPLRGGRSAERRWGAQRSTRDACLRGTPGA
jgi:hypothetical protein